MGGLGALFVIGLYFFIAYKVVKWAKPTWLKAIVLMAALLIPTADAIYGRIKLKQMCVAEAGLKVYRVAEHVEGFMDEGSRDYWVKNHEYLFAEDYPTNGTVTRYSRQDSQIVKEDHVLPKSRYKLRLRQTGDKESYSRTQFLIEDIATGEILATDSQIGFNGGWAEKLIAAFSDGGINPKWCTTSEIDPAIRHKRIALSALKD